MKSSPRRFTRLRKCAGRAGRFSRLSVRAAMRRHFSRCRGSGGGAFAKVFPWLFMVLPTVTLTSGVAAQPADTVPDHTCVDLIREAQGLVSNDPARASELLARAIVRCEHDQAVNLQQQEELRWSIAQLNLERAEETQNRCQKYELGDLARQYWFQYIAWHDALSPEQHAALDPTRDRIQLATRFLGNAIVARGSASACTGRTAGIRELFSVYSDLDVDQFSSQTTKFWKEWLWKCPDWPVEPSKSYRRLSRDYCSADEELVCEAEWLDYRDFLGIWIERKGRWLSEGRPRDRMKDLSRGSIRSFTRELERINTALSCEGG